MKFRSASSRLPAVTLAAVAATSGCASKQSVKAKSLKSGAAATALADCGNITVHRRSPCRPRKRRRLDRRVEFAQSIERAPVAATSVPLFDSVEFASAARGVDHECVIEGNITKYKHGQPRRPRHPDRPRRRPAWKATSPCEDAATGTALLNAPFDKLWAWGGIVGASKGMRGHGQGSQRLGGRHASPHAKGWNGNAAGIVSASALADRKRPGESPPPAFHARHVSS